MHLKPSQRDALNICKDGSHSIGVQQTFKRLYPHPLRPHSHKFKSKQSECMVSHVGEWLPLEGRGEGTGRAPAGLVAGSTLHSCPGASRVKTHTHRLYTVRFSLIY